jgi:hypothetical protein
MSTHTLIPIIYNPKDKLTDYNYLIKQYDNKDALFIFNDNYIHHKTDIKGGGNAIVRPYNKYGKFKSKPKSAGITTGLYEGFIYLDDIIDSKNVKEIIDSDINEIRELIKKHNYNKIYFSYDKKNDTIGTGIFNVGKKVKEYIYSSLLTL